LGASKGMSLAYLRSVMKNNRMYGVACALAVVLLLGAGAAYKLVALKMDMLTKAPIKLDVPLREFPIVIGDWVGRDVHIAEIILDVAAVDDFLNRMYENESSNQSANVYIAYTARPRTMLGHRPQVCYPANGWRHEGTESIQIISDSGRKFRCLLHIFQKPFPETDKIVVLNYYIVNGRLTDDESVFSGLNWRTPNIEGNPARYVAQVQISSGLENSVRRLAKDITELVLNFFP